jgi:hypothetical protein
MFIKPLNDSSLIKFYKRRQSRSIDDYTTYENTINEIEAEESAVDTPIDLSSLLEDNTDRENKISKKAKYIMDRLD